MILRAQSTLGLLGQQVERGRVGRAALVAPRARLSCACAMGMLQRLMFMAVQAAGVLGDRVGVGGRGAARLNRTSRETRAQSSGMWCIAMRHCKYLCNMLQCNNDVTAVVRQEKIVGQACSW